MRGEKVIVRALDNQPLARVVWDVLPKVVLITTEEIFLLLKTNQKDAMAIGFPKEDVFQFDEAALRSFLEPPTVHDWKKLQQYAN